ncbi:MAG TPA: agmatinase family protein [Myxococcales bacterium]|nr:agmatinase family protein [Myxococcales bacterium]
MSFDPNAAASADSGIFGLNDTPQSARVILVPVPFEATTSYGGGTSQGPAAILRASKQVDLWDLETGKPYEAGISMLAEPVFPEPAEREPPSVNPISQQVNSWVHDSVARWLERGKIVGTVGGDHSVSFGAIAAHAEKYPGLGVLHFDAHADLRHAYEGFEHSHASIMDNVVRRTRIEKLVQVGIRDLCEEEAERIRGSGGKIVTFFDAELAEARFAGETWAAQCARIVAELPRQVYVSFDIDGLDPALCPHTGTKVPGGLSFQMATSLIGAVVKSGRTLVGFDLTEVAPARDGSEWDENVGARMLYKLIGWSLASIAGN